MVTYLYMYIFSGHSVYLLAVKPEIWGCIIYIGEPCHLENHQNWNLILYLFNEVS